jgi:glucans biosynthesis protein
VKPQPMKPYRYGYSMAWTRETEHEQPISPNRVISTRIGVDSRNSAQREFAIDFAGPKFDTIPENAPPTSIANCSANATIAFNSVYRNPYTHSWRVILKLEPKPDNKDPVDIRCTLQKGEEVLGETWTYHWSPP